MAVAAAIAAAAAAGTIAAIFVFSATGGVERSNVAAQSTAQVQCRKALLDDWSDGRIDGAYPIRCYRAALRALPADLQIYSSAPSDIAQALSQRIIQSAGGRETRRLLGR
jgi:hypothetical protein